MRSLQTVAMGLLIVFLDGGSGGWDWIADPIGWVLVLVGLVQAKEQLTEYRPLLLLGWGCLAVSVVIFPPGSVVTIDESLGWLFSLPTFLFGVLLCGSLATVTETPLPTRFRWLRIGFAVVAAVPALIYGLGWTWLTVPTTVAAVLVNVLLVVWVWAAGDEKTPEVARASKPEKPKPSPQPLPQPSTQPSPQPSTEPRERRMRRAKEPGFDAEAVKRRVRRERDG